MSLHIDRRLFLIGLISANLALSFPKLSAKAAQVASSGSQLHFLQPDEARILAALVDRLIPADDFPSASEAGVVDYIDLQLASAWGKGARLYLQGPFSESTPEQGYQLHYAPADLYRAALKAIIADDPQTFLAKSDADKDAYIIQLEKNQIKLGDIPGSVFFEALRSNTMEGYFGDPAYGGNRDFGGWRMIGFPGADAYYLTEIDRYNLVYERAPSSIANSIGTKANVFKPAEVPIDTALRVVTALRLGE